LQHQLLRKQFTEVCCDRDSSLERALAAAESEKQVIGEMKFFKNKCDTLEAVLKEVNATVAAQSKQMTVEVPALQAELRCTKEKLQQMQLDKDKMQETLLVLATLADPDFAKEVETVAIDCNLNILRIQDLISATVDVRVPSVDYDTVTLPEHVMPGNIDPTQPDHNVLQSQPDLRMETQLQRKYTLEYANAAYLKCLLAVIQDTPSHECVKYDVEYAAMQNGNTPQHPQSTTDMDIAARLSKEQSDDPMNTVFKTNQQFYTHGKRKLLQKLVSKAYVDKFIQSMLEQSLIVSYPSKEWGGPDVDVCIPHHAIALRTELIKASLLWKQQLGKVALIKQQLDEANLQIQEYAATVQQLYTDFDRAVTEAIKKRDAPSTNTGWAFAAQVQKQIMKADNAPVVEPLENMIIRQLESDTIRMHKRLQKCLQDMLQLQSGNEIARYLQQELRATRAQYENLCIQHEQCPVSSSKYSILNEKYENALQECAVLKDTLHQTRRQLEIISGEHKGCLHMIHELTSTVSHSNVKRKAMIELKHQVRQALMDLPTTLPFLVEDTDVGLRVHLVDQWRDFFTVIDAQGLSTVRDDDIIVGIQRVQIPDSSLSSLQQSSSPSSSISQLKSVLRKQVVGNLISIEVKRIVGFDTEFGEDEVEFVTCWTYVTSLSLMPPLTQHNLFSQIVHTREDFESTVPSGSNDQSNALFVSPHELIPITINAVNDLMILSRIKESNDNDLLFAAAILKISIPDNEFDAELQARNRVMQTSS
jgi:hypothetical protein